MKFDTGDRFLPEYRRLPAAHRALFRAAVDRINEAYAKRSGPIPAWPASLRIMQMRGHDDLWEMTWSFAGPDGRATFRFVTIDGELAIRWRRIGDHRIYDDP